MTKIFNQNASNILITGKSGTVLVLLNEKKKKQSILTCVKNLSRHSTHRALSRTHGPIATGITAGGQALKTNRFTAMCFIYNTVEPRNFEVAWFDIPVASMSRIILLYIQCK